MNINSKAELKGNKYKCLRVVKGAAIEDIPAMRINFTKQIEGIKGASMTETDSAFEFSNGQFVLKPKQQRETIGTLDCTRSFASFNGSRIEYKDIDNVFASCFETSNAKYAIHAVV